MAYLESIVKRSQKIVHALGVAGQLHAVGGVVAADVCDDGQFAFGFTHDGFQHGLALIDVLIDALTGGAAHIHALDALCDQMAGQCLDALGGDIALCVVTGIEGRDNALILGNVFHLSMSFLIIQALHALRSGNGSSALLRFPASASCLGAALASC